MVRMTLYLCKQNPLFVVSRPLVMLGAKTWGDGRLGEDLFGPNPAATSEAIST